MLPCHHRYAAYAQAAMGPNIVIDGAANENAVLTLSHWPQSGTPWPLKADTSVGIVFNYLESPEWQREVETVTNDHFDEDGLIGMFCMIEPEFALQHRGLLNDASHAGDFGTYQDRRAARIAFTVSRLADPALSPWGAELFGPNPSADYPLYCSTAYQRLLAEFRSIVEYPEAYREIWEDEDHLLTASETAIEQGEASLEECDDLDLAIVRVPENWPEKAAHRFAQHLDVLIHPMAVYNLTDCNRIVTVSGDRIRFDYRYESWVQMVTRRPPPRVDLSALSAALDAMDGDDNRWRFDGVEQITPSLRTEHGRTRIDESRFLEVLTEALRYGEPAWDPYDPVPSQTT